MRPIEEVMSLLGQSQSIFHVVKNIEDRFLEAGFIGLSEGKPFELEPGKKYFVKRNDSSIIGFKIPKKPAKAYRITATHNDSPTFMIKPTPLVEKGGVTQLNTEPYGGFIYYSWLDRPLSFAGRLFVKEGDEVKSQLVNLDENALIIPSLAIHMRRSTNEGVSLGNPAKDTVPIWLDRKFEGTFYDYLKDVFDIKGEVISHELSLYVREKPKFVGGTGNLLFSPRLDDLACVYTSLLGFLAAKEKEESNIQMFASFDNEEVGSLTYQGANSDFLKNVLRRIGDCLGWSEEDRQIAQANSILLSADNAHANHPNYLEMSDATTDVRLNGGVVLKYNAAQHYTTNARSAAYVKMLGRKLNQPIQEYTNRSDIKGGSTLGNLSNSEISLVCADIGIAQLAMHSSIELCGAVDIGRMTELLQLHYENE